MFIAPEMGIPARIEQGERVIRNRHTVVPLKNSAKDFMTSLPIPKKHFRKKTPVQVVFRK